MEHFRWIQKHFPLLPSVDAETESRCPVPELPQHFSHVPSMPGPMSGAPHTVLTPCQGLKVFAGTWGQEGEQKKTWRQRLHEVETQDTLEFEIQGQGGRRLLCTLAPEPGRAGSDTHFDTLFTPNL